MTKKDYIKIAEVLKPIITDKRETTKEYIAYKLGDMLKADNNRFDYRRFLIACGVNVN